MKKLLISFVAIALSSCSLLPSKWDSVSVQKLVDVRVDLNALDCAKDIVPQINNAFNKTESLRLYTQYRGIEDVNKMVQTLSKTEQELIDRTKQGNVSSVYCQLKKNILVEQADIIGHTIKGSVQ